MRPRQEYLISGNSLMQTRKNNLAALDAGFTLIELLIVIGVIATLISLTFTLTTLSDSRESCAKADLRLFSVALHAYKDANGGVCPPDTLPPDVEMSPYEEMAEMQRDKETSAALFYFLTTCFYTDFTEDPQNVGKKRMGGYGPFLLAGSIGESHLANSQMLDNQIINLAESTYTGKATWLKDPWGTPYRYVLKDKGRRFYIESAGPDGKFGSKFVTEEEGGEETIQIDDEDEMLDNLRSDLISR